MAVAKSGVDAFAMTGAGIPSGQACSAAKTSLTPYRVRLAPFLGYATGLLVIMLAITVGLTDWSLTEVLAWVERIFGITFMIGLSGLVAIVALAIHALMREPARDDWFELGLQAANGVATLALTFTLLGISLGIGSLAEQPLTPETVPTVIQSLTGHFATAFMTSVVGLPVAALSRATLSVMRARYALRRAV